MKIKLPALALLALGLSACTSGDMHFQLVDDTIGNYGGAIRWGAFEKAQEYQNPTKRHRLDLDWLKNIHVTGYEQVYRKDSPGSDIYEVTVEIRYFIEPYSAEKKITDRQLWRFYEEQKKLMLETDLPTFR